MESSIESDSSLKSLLLVHAQASAKFKVCEWIRRTLHEAFLQALQRSWTVSRNADVAFGTSQPTREKTSSFSETNNPSLRIELSSQSLKCACDFVTRLARLWKLKLEDQGQHLVSAWVQEVHDSGSSNLWRFRKLSSEQHRKKHPENDTTNRSTLDKRPLEPSAHGTPTNTTSMPYTRLRQLGLRTNHIPSLRSEVLNDLTHKSLHTIREMGRRGETYWPQVSNDPNDQCWEKIDELIDKIPGQQHANKAPSSRTQRVSSPSFKVIPKSLWDRQKQQRSAGQTDTENPDQRRNTNLVGDPSRAEDLTEVTQSQALALFVRQRCQNNTTEQLRRKREKTKTDLPPAADETTRPASNLGEERYTIEDIVADLNPSELNCLNDLIHQDDDDDLQRSSLKPLVLFGALKSVGHTHYHLQRCYDKSEESTDGDATEDETGRTRRRKFNQAFYERLGPNQLDANINPASYRSKVLRTCCREEPKAFALELDMGQCLMEVRLSTEDETNDNQTKNENKILCAFSSLEILIGEDRGDSALLDK